MSEPRPRVLSDEVVARLAAFRLANHRRVQGRYAGAHRSRRLGSSLDFADEREYVPGDDPRSVDLNASRRLGRLLVKLYEAEDEAAVRVVVDLSASMGFGRKVAAAREVAASFAAMAANGQDRVRVLLVGGVPVDGDAITQVDAGPWYRGPVTLPAVEHRLLGTAPPGTDGPAPGRAHLVAALRQAHGEGPRGPVVLVSDLLFTDWEGTLRALAAGRGDAILVHLLGREDLEPSLRGDLRLVDAETGDDVEVGITEESLDDYRRARDQWLADVAAEAGALGIARVTTLDDMDLSAGLLHELRALGVVA